MRYCQICGDTRRVKYYPSKRQSLCAYCATSVPRKVSRAVFDKKYWNGHPENVPIGIRREFYEDYLRSGDTLPQYMKATISEH